MFMAEQRHKSVILIREGKLRPRPEKCEECGAEPGRTRIGGVSLVQMHHPDYFHPELIEWLCPRCHRIANRERAKVLSPT